MNQLIFLAAVALAFPAVAHAGPADEVSQEHLRSNVEHLVGFGTRHTLSDQTSETRGIGAARKWGEAQFRASGEACGGCLTIVLPERMIEGSRVPEPTRLVDVVAIQRGTERPNEVIIVQGHIDSRVSDVMDFTSDAPGANDDGSGTALVLEAARVLSQRRYPVTIVYALLSGEEQGLYGAQVLADYAQEHGWQVKAVLNNDIVGGSCGSDGYCDDEHVRVFSEGPRADLTDAARAAQRRDGGENDSPSRNLSRWIDTLAEADKGGLDVRQILRTDRMGRGGDHIPYLEKGYPAVRFSVAVEDYEHQHQDLRTEDGVKYGDTIDEMDFPYLAKVTRLNVRVLEALAQSPMPPAPTTDAAVRTDTAIKWKGVPGASVYSVVGRRTDEPGWTKDFGIVSLEQKSESRPETPIESREFTFTAPVRGDDWIFGVYSVGTSGVESPVASAVPGGGFVPLSQQTGDSD